MVTVYTGATCAPCKTLKYFLDKRGIAFTEKPVEQYEDEVVALAGMKIVPVTLIDDQVVIGPNLSRISQLVS